MAREEVKVLYISFGQDHIHRVNNQTFDKDCIAEIKCDNYGHGRAIAFDLFSDRFGTDYLKADEKLMSFFPRGIIKAN